MVLKFYASVAEGLKLKIRKFWRLILTFEAPIRPSEEGGWGGGAKGASAPSKFSVDVLFLKEVTKNIHENQQAKPRAS